MFEFKTILGFMNKFETDRKCKNFLIKRRFSDKEMCIL